MRCTFLAATFLSALLTAGIAACSGNSMPGPATAERKPSAAHAAPGHLYVANLSGNSVTVYAFGSLWGHPWTGERAVPSRNKTAMWARLISFVASIGFIIASALPALANLPPPQQFPGTFDKDAKGQGILVITADKYGGAEPSGVTQRTGSEYDTHRYCHVLLDFEVQDGAKGVFTIRGSTTGYVAGRQGPFIDEIAPVSMPAANLVGVPFGTGFKQMSMVVPLRHGVTFFEWTPSSDSTGAFYVWATPIPCGLNIEGFNS